MMIIDMQQISGKFSEKKSENFSKRVQMQCTPQEYHLQ